MNIFRPMFFKTIKNYTRKQFFKDLSAGLVVAIIALPLSIALAIASGVSPEKGLHTAIIAGFLISFFGGSKVQIGGPTGAFMVIVYGIVLEFGIEGLIIATFLAGIIMILMGLMKLGSVIKYIPYPITTGFTTGIALIIFTSQIKDLFGLNTGNLPPEFIDKWQVYGQSFSSISIQDTIIGVITLLTLIAWPKINKKVPGALVALLVASLISLVLGLDVNTIGSRFGDLSTSLPQLNFPNINKDNVSLLVGSAFAIAFLGAIESLLSAMVADSMIDDKHNSNTELIAQGIANIGSSLFGGIPATGAIARTAANVKNGGRTPVSGMVHAVTLLLIMLLFLPLAKVIPLSSLAAILIVVAYNMSEWRQFMNIFKSSKSDVIVLLTTFFITVLIDLVLAIEIGMVLAALLFLKRMAEESTVNVREVYTSNDTTDDDISINSDNGALIYKINGPFFYGATDKFVDVINNLNSDTRTIIVVMKNVPAMDASALVVFNKLINRCKHRNIKLLVVGIKRQPLNLLLKSETYHKIGEENFYDKIEQAIGHVLYNESTLTI